MKRVYTFFSNYLTQTAFRIGMHGKNGFASKASKNLASYRSKNFFCWSINIIIWTLKLIAKISKFFAALSLCLSTSYNILIIQHNYFQIYI